MSADKNHTWHQEYQPTGTTSLRVSSAGAIIEILGILEIQLFWIGMFMVVGGGCLAVFGFLLGITSAAKFGVTWRSTLGIAIGAVFTIQVFFIFRF